MRPLASSPVASSPLALPPLRLPLLLILAFVFAGSASAERPNILWITSEDNGQEWVSAYGGTNADTPAIDGLAREGFRYLYCYDNAAVCAPSRSLWITGMHAISNGTQPMRSRNAIPHERIRYYPDLLREAGYHTSNPGKTDYNIGGRPDADAWDVAQSDDPYGWRAREAGQPFFSVFNITDSHERWTHGESEQTRSDPARMRLASYHPDLPEIRETYARYADAVENMDRTVAACLAALEADGLTESTIVIYNSDHGGVMARSKRFVYSSGIHCPLIVRIPEKFRHLYPADRPGTTVDRLVSFVDMPKTWLSLAGAEIPETFQGRIFLGSATEPEPEHHLAYRERADERLDSVRVIRDTVFSYHRNYMPYAPAGQHLAYLWKARGTEAWERHHREGRTDDVTGRFFRPRVSEEFYDNRADFDNVVNLIDRPEHQAKIAAFRDALRAKQLEVFDSGLLPEKMRERRAEQNGLTIYDLVRDRRLYPLADYLDAADAALERDAANLNGFMARMAHDDEGQRWWAVVGLHLLDDEAAPARAVLDRALLDEAHEVRMMAAWTLVKLGESESALACLEELLFGGTQNPRMLHNVLDWMGEPALALVKKHIERGGATQDTHGISILGRVAQLQGWIE